VLTIEGMLINSVWQTEMKRAIKLRSQINTIEEKYYIRIGSLGYGFQVTAS
jgi:hypothetical protein